MLKKIFLVLCLLTLTCSFSRAQNDYLKMQTAVGIYGNLNMNMHSPQFDYNPTLKFDKNKTSFNFSLGAIANFPINDIFTISGRLGYNGMNGKLDGFFRNSYIEDTMTAYLSYLEISPVVQFHNLLPLRNLYFLAGLELGIPITKKYDLGVNTDSTLSDASTRLAVAIGAGYVFKLSENVFLAPELSYRIPFTNVSSNDKFKTWDVPQLRLGVSLTFGLGKKDSKPGEIPEPQDSELSVKMKEVRYLDNQGNRYPMDRIKVEDVQYAELFPVLPYVFFDENVETPNEKQQIVVEKSEQGEFSANNLEPDAIKINLHTLDVIGVRMVKYNNADLTITGTTDNKKEKNSKTLSSQRAEYAKNYLVNNYQINQERINVRAIGLPLKPSSSNVADGVAENRRIEFTSSNPKILEPIMIQGDNDRIAEPHLVEFQPEVISSDSITYWEMDLYQGGRDLRKYSGTGQLPPIQWTILPNELTNKQLPVEYNLKVTNLSGITRSFSGSLPVEYYSFTRKKSENQPDKTISKYSLVLFDFDKSEVSDKDMEIINNHIVPAIKFNSTVKIYGYTDRIGDEKHNQKLAERRANSVKEILSQKVKEAKYEVYGVGESVYIYNNDNPIGRHLSRTVQVQIVTPK